VEDDKLAPEVAIGMHNRMGLDCLGHAAGDERRERVGPAVRARSTLQKLAGTSDIDLDEGMNDMTACGKISCVDYDFSIAREGEPLIGHDGKSLVSCMDCSRAAELVIMWKQFPISPREGDFSGKFFRDLSAWLNYGEKFPLCLLNRVDR
jgi:hypothetical protein